MAISLRTDALGKLRAFEGEGQCGRLMAAAEEELVADTAGPSDISELWVRATCSPGKNRSKQALTAVGSTRLH